MGTVANMPAKVAAPRAPQTDEDWAAALSLAEAERARAIADNYDNPTEATERAVLDTSRAVELVTLNRGEAARRRAQAAAERAAAECEAKRAKVASLMARATVECPAALLVECEKIAAALCTAADSRRAGERFRAEAKAAQHQAEVLARELGDVLPNLVHPADIHATVRRLLQAAGDPDAFDILTRPHAH
jgi:hypothetical protein